MYIPLLPYGEKCAQQLPYRFHILEKLESFPQENQNPYSDMDFSKNFQKVSVSGRSFEPKKVGHHHPSTQHQKQATHLDPWEIWDIRLEIPFLLKIKQKKSCGNLNFFLKILPEITFVLKIQKNHIPIWILIFIGATLQLDITF